MHHLLFSLLSRKKYPDLDRDVHAETKPSSQQAQNKAIDITLKHKLGDATNKWMLRNRSLVLRQTPVWAQRFAGILIGLGSIAFIGACFFRIDEVVTVSPTSIYWR